MIDHDDRKHIQYWEILTEPAYRTDNLNEHSTIWPN